MRPILIAAAASLMMAGAAAAADIGPVSEIRIGFGDKIEDKNRIFGQREKAELEAELRRAVVRELGGLKADGGVLELTIVDAKPNRPTFTQMQFEPSISYIHSFGIGGATVEGAYVGPDGSRTPVRYSWFESDIRNAQHVTEWHDVRKAFNRFADRLYPHAASVRTSPAKRGEGTGRPNTAKWGRTADSCL